MYVVLDTSAVFTDLLFVRANSQILLGHQGPATYHVAVPTAVVMEHEKKLREKIKDEHDRLVSAARALDQNGVTLPLPDIDVEAEAKRIHEQVMKGLRDQGVEFPPTPNVALDELARRSVNELKPWGKKSAGYRDALIWETVKEIAKNGPVLLVSQNPRDFCEDGEKSVLHPDLIEDLTNDGINQDVEVAESIAAAVERLVTPSAKAYRNVSEKLNSDPTFRGEIKLELDQVLIEAQIEPWDSVTITETGVPVAHVDIAVSAIQDFRLLTAYSLNDNDPDANVVLTFEVNAHVKFEFSAPAGAEPYLQIERGTDAAKVGGWALAESGWRPVRLFAQAKYNPKSGQVSEWTKASLSDREDV